MATQLTSFTFKSGVADKSTHDWDSLLDGQIWQLESGKDYNCKTSTFATLARNQAKKKGLGLRTNKIENGIVIQAVSKEAGDMEPVEGEENLEADEPGEVVPPEPEAPKPAPVKQPPAKAGAKASAGKRK